MLSSGTLEVGALARHLQREDPAFAYEEAGRFPVLNGSVYVLLAHSQSWRSPHEVTPCVWRHWISILVPDEIVSETALLWIEGGSVNSPAPRHMPQQFVMAACMMKTVLIQVHGVANQPLHFADESEPRFESGIDSYSHVKVMAEGDPEWCVTLPMVKSVVRAMDACQDFLSTRGIARIENFVLAGGSKRGNIGLLTAASDARAAGVIPIGVESVNIRRQLKHMYDAYGFYSEAWSDFIAAKVFDKYHDGPGELLMSIVDPYYCLDRITAPKLFLVATGCEYFMPDSAQFYFHELPGEKHYRAVPNVNHKFRHSDAVTTALTFFYLIARKQPRPRFSWTFPEEGFLTVASEETPIAARLWQAVSPDARDFRLKTLGPAWTASELSPEGDNIYTARVLQPASGWTAYFVELVFDVGIGMPFTLTTEVDVLPKTLPFQRETDAL